MMNWKEPTAEMTAAFWMARRVPLRKFGLNQIQFAEWVLSAKESLWYLQATQWAEQAPTAVGTDSKEAFKRACALVVKIVDLGYDAERGQWWPLRALFETEDEWAIATLRLMDLGIMMQRLPDVAEYPDNITREEKILGTVVPGFTIVSAGFQVFVSLMRGPQ